MRSLEGGDWKSTYAGNSLVAYPTANTPFSKQLVSFSAPKEFSRTSAHTITKLKEDHTMQASYIPQEMEVVAEVLSAIPERQREYLIDRQELLRLREEKLIQDKLFVYLAIKLSYDTCEPHIDIPWFCDQWEIKEEVFSTAIAQLHKKGALQPVARQLTLQLF